MFFSSLFFSIRCLPRCQLHGFAFDRPLSVNGNDDQEKHFYATYDQHSAFLRREPTPNRTHQQEQYSLV